jgi:murein DD-endopeptidase MepM/ murein hydrolase activator NlpD
LLISLAIFASLPARADAAPDPGWKRPVPGAVARPFEPPRHRFGPGHLGVDFRAAPGRPVRAAGPGEVTVAGDVAGALHVVVAHAGGLRTSYSFLATVAVHRGARVRAGDVIGTSGGAGPNHERSVLHLGLRAGDEYVDPMLLFGAVDLTEVVHLAPTSQPFGFSAADERRGLLDGLGGLLGDVVDASAAAGGAFARAGGAARAAAVTASGTVAATTVRVGDAAATQVQRIVSQQPSVLLARELLDYTDERRHCDASAPDADGTGGSGHHLMVVAGIDSRTDENGVTLPLPVDDLGYHSDEVSFFSYARDGGAYDKEDTYAPLLRSAHLLAAQLREQQRRDPGREVDLIAHSQGGVVVLAFLKLVYEPGDPSYPPLGTVVTLSSPLAGAPLASTIARASSVPGADAVLRRADAALGDNAPDLESPALRDLAEGSEFMQRLAAASLPPVVQMTTVGSTYDYVVPADHSSSADAERRTVVETVVSSGHSRVVDDADAMRATRAALEGAPLPCRSFGAFVRAELVPRVVSTVEQGGSR